MKPILFNTPMTQAILEDCKTVTRRKPFQMPSEYNELKGLYRDDKNRLCAVFQCSKDLTTQAVYAPYQPGDILWVRETWAHPSTAEIAAGADPNMYLYKADSMQPAAWDKWRPSIHMPKEAARLFLRVKAVRVERLQDIDYEGCKAEGVWDDYKTTSQKYHDNLAKRAYPVVFAELWNGTIKPADLPLYGWEANPWVWVIEFERISKEEAINADQPDS